MVHTFHVPGPSRRPAKGACDVLLPVACREGKRSISCARVKMLVLLICGTVLATSGPLPACLWDDALSWAFSTISSADNLVAVRAPTSNDTPDEINRGYSQQQSLGFENTFAKSHPCSDLVLFPFTLPIVRCISYDCRVVEPRHAVVLLALSGESARTFPLLI